MKFRLLLVLFFSCGWASLHAEIKVIPEREYFGLVHDELTKAQESIDIIMYLIKLGEDTPKVKALLDNLIIAQDRGVKVKVILEDQRENEEAYEYLKEKVAIQFDSSETKTHTKTILIDGKRLIIGSSNWSEAAFNKNHESNVLVDLEDDRAKILLLEGKDYPEKLMEVLRSCRETLDIVMYLFIVESNRKDDPVYHLMEELFRLKKEGVKIRLILDSWEEGIWSKNEEIKSLLGLGDISVYYDSGSIATHNKLVIADRRQVLLGSANWTRQALSENEEASIAINEIKVARRFSDYFESLLKDLPEGELKDCYFSLPLYLIKKGGPLNWLVVRRADVSLRLYLWFIWESLNKNTLVFPMDKVGWYDAIFLPEPSRTSSYKWGIMNDCLEFLERGGLIRREREEVILSDPERPKGLRSSPQDYFYIPVKLMESGWFKKLSATALYVYFVNLAEFKFSPIKPYWFKSQFLLEKRYGFSSAAMSRGLQELMEYNLIEIIHDIPASGQDFNERKANRYLLNPLFTEEEMKGRWQDLEKRHGGLFYKARPLAAKLNEPEDPKVVADLILLIKIYGEEAVREGIDKVNNFSIASGRREMRYLIGILQKDYKPN